MLSTPKYNKNLENRLSVYPKNMDSSMNLLQPRHEDVFDKNDIVDEMPKRFRRCNKDYDEVARFVDLASAVEALKNEVGGQRWTRRDTKDVDVGVKRYYTCRDFPRCPKGAYLLLHAESFETSFWVSSNEHVHELSNKKPLLPVETVDCVKRAITEGKKMLLIYFFSVGSGILKFFFF